MIKTADLHLTMLWIKEVEIAKSIDERSITGQHKFPDFDMLDVMIASALKKLLNTQSNFRTRVSVEEWRAQKDDRFLRGRQTAQMLYEFVRATRAYEAVQRLSDLFTISSQNDDVQDCDVRWDHQPAESTSLLSRSRGYTTCTSARICTPMVCVRWRKHVPGGSGAHDEGTGGVSSICNEDQGGRSTRPRCHYASVARKCCYSRKTFNLCMHATLTFFVRQVGCLAMCRMRSLGSCPSHSMKHLWLRQGCIWPQF